MFILNKKPLPLDVPFTHNGIQYPANWLRLATPDERAAIGITEKPDDPVWDQRFFWGYDKDGGLIPKDHKQLISTWKEQTRTTAGTLLSPTDWMITREVDNKTPTDPTVKSWRQAIRLSCNDKVDKIAKTRDTFDLASYVTSVDYSSWPQQGSNLQTAVAASSIPAASGADTIVFNDFGATDSGINSVTDTLNMSPSRISSGL